MSNSHINPESIASINGQIQEYKELVEVKLSGIVSEFESLNWTTSSGQEFQNNELDTLYRELKSILAIIDDEISPYLNEKYHLVCES